jgi:hypothetical protein
MLIGYARVSTPDLFGVPRSTVYGHLDKSKTIPRQPKRSTGPAAQEP